jgi:PAS domain S-box-containing protein
MQQPPSGSNELEQNLVRLRPVLDTVQDGLIIADPGGRVLEMNSAAMVICDLESRTEACVPLQQLDQRLDLLDAQDRPLPLSAWPLNRILDGETIRAERARLRNLATGRVRVVQYGGSALRGPDGRVLLAVLTLRDVTAAERTAQQLRESEQRFRAMADGLPLIVWVHDAEGRQRFVNQTFCDFFGVDRTEMRDERWRMLVHPEDAEAYTRAFSESVRDQRAFHAEARVRRADGQWRWIESWARPRFSEAGDCLGYVGASADVTDRRRLESELRRLTVELEQRVAERTVELERRAEQLARLSAQLTVAEQRERRRLAVLLHDHLQQYIAGAKMRLEVMGPHVATEHQPHLDKTRELLAEALRASRSLSAQLAPHVLYDRGLAAGLEWLAHHMQDNYQLRVDTAIDPELCIEREDLRLLLFESVRELLFNAVKHAESPTARLEMARTAGGELCITVSDQGKGLDAEALAIEGDSGDQFGLFSIRERLQMLGGRQEVDSAPGRGTTFRLLVPQRPAADSAPPAAAAAPAAPAAEPLVAGAGTRILLADDHAVMREGITALLDGQPDLQVVAEAQDGAEAVARARELRPDLILMDINMPQMDGIRATRTIRAELPQIPILGLSMHDDQSTIRAMLDAGAAALVSKSDPAETLLAAIRRSCRATNEKSETVTEA